MGFWKRVVDAFSASGSERPKQELTLGRHMLTPLMSAYENMFAQLRPLIDEMKVVRPYGVGRNKARLPATRTPELTVLADPNDEMGWGEFADAMFATWLSEPALYIHVWRDAKGGVKGYSLLPFSSRQLLTNGEEQWQFMSVGSGMVTLKRDEVMTLRFSRSPKNLDIGVSPATVAMVWTQLDDLVAQYERAYFENGAVPATITFITAPSREKFEEKRRALENGLKGARNRNKTIFAYRSMLDDGTTGDEIEVKQIQGNNSTMAIRDLVEIINDRMNKSVGVSNFILGDDSSAKYDNAELSDHQFTKRRVYPALVSFWGQFQHELDRITGGLGYAISFDLEIPELTDRLLTKASIKKIEAETQTVWLNNRLLELQIAKEKKAQEEEAEPGSTRASEREETEETLPTNLGKTRTADEYEPKWDLPAEKNIKAIYDILMVVAKDLANEYPELALDETKAKIVDRLRLDAQDGVLEEAKALKRLTLTGEAKEYVGQVIQDVNYYPLPEELVNTLETRVGYLMDKYDADTRAAFAEITAQARAGGITEAEIKKKLLESLPKARAEMIARSETHSAVLAGSYSLDKSLAQKYRLKMTVEWYTKNPNACDLCKAMAGTKYTVDEGEGFPDHVWGTDSMGSVVEFAFPHTKWNAGGTMPNAHPNCTCQYITRLERSR